MIEGTGDEPVRAAGEVLRPIAEFYEWHATGASDICRASRTPPVRPSLELGWNGTFVFGAAFPSRAVTCHTGTA